MLSNLLRPVVRLADRLRGAHQDPVSTVMADDPSVQPYAGGSGADGVLLIHGFTGTPQAMRPWAEHLETNGFTVSLPRLPGHGTHWRELNQTAWTDWYAHADAAFVDLRARCDRVFLAGLSMGGALCLRLAEQHGNGVAGLVLVNPALNITDPRMKILPVLRYLVGSLAAIGNDVADPARQEVAYDRTPLHALHSQTFLWADVVAHLELITQPVLVFRSEQDHVVDPSSLAILQDRLGTNAEYRTLTRSYHVATLDYEAEEIFAASSEFFRRVSSAGSGSTGPRS
ncbi:MAG: alpha/beta fold hydrolase [Microlunatus sp.]|nr:alpha/beta fold hydrolase [Microlunatus sp.]MDN5769819.1 alpha/beta fold hydrolase [Microlunatus sp.]